MNNTGLEMKSLLLSICISLLFIANASAGNELRFINPWIPEAPPGAGVLAGFMEIHNSGNQDIIIQQISSPTFKRVEMHLSVETNGTASMQPQKTLTVPANSKLILKSGGFHLMLIEPEKRLLDGDKIVLRFKFSSANTSSANTLEQIVPVRKASATKPTTMKCGSGKCGTGK
ncbi:hypothetical protein MNBD_GAMMA09-967 [hydrothermal vent metagenome]|uniref:Copper metallochaperone, bacterial analog of Cox17 protein n=1 Tax=hydrothermal vent metagenome TaxID=652676 RepID=A0A3B0XRU6_9ZZZZ